MSKADFIERVADAGDLSKAEAKRAVELVFGQIEAGLKASKKEGKYTIGTFGTFSVSKRKARMVATHAQAKRSRSKHRRHCGSARLHS